MSNLSVHRTRIAIIGGGLAGTVLANALLQRTHLDVHLFEADACFSERGAAIGLSSAAQSALKHIIPSADELLAKAGAVPMNSTRTMIGSGVGAASLVLDLARTSQGKVVHRGSLLRELLSGLPSSMLHTRKKLTDMKSSDDGVELTFEDGYMARFDAVVGADGIFSRVREHVTRDPDGVYAASPAGFWDCRNVVAVEKARDVLGQDLFRVNRQYGWIGNGSFIMHDVLDHGHKIQCVISGVEAKQAKNRATPLSRHDLNLVLKDWLDGPIAKGVIELVLDQDNPQRFSQWEHKSTPTYSNGRTCIMGDAAHATTPWQGYGLGLAIEDAVILSTLLTETSSCRGINTAFKAYDAVRRPRCQMLIDSSRGTGRILCGQDGYAGLEPGRLNEVLASRWDFIHGLDIEAHKQDALDALKGLQALMME
ncbi:salicylate hydroxylase [Metarhizium guizhouense ARSEF 977]|uniref:Salicylate hydroxylase n=1 Tax=Metarhizium guizhouense (strain ARSEF 977) TaxID=1276136 RepID=A0A0B4HTP4_METGA|nr:salicylate hydroxylase [Metarhizium guizhouense ARSEF 977]